MIRQWTLGDIPAISKIESESFTDPWNETMLKESLDSPAFRGLLSETDGVVTGYVGFILCGDAEIALIAVSKDFRKNGLGNALLCAAIENAENSGAQNVFLEVRESNKPARALYEKNGFVQIAQRIKYYEDGEDALVMVKCLR